jgi:hypothetical protein
VYDIGFKSVDRDGGCEAGGFLAAPLVQRPVEIAHARKPPCRVGVADEENTQIGVGCRAHPVNVAICGGASIDQKDKVHCSIRRVRADVCRLWALVGRISPMGGRILVLFQPEKLVFFIALAQFDSSMKLP